MIRLSRRTKRYLVIGVAVYLFELTVIIVAQLFGASAVLAVALSFWLGLATSFGLQKFVTFEDHRTRPKILLPQIAAYCLLVLFNFGFTVLMARLLENHLPTWLIRSGALATTTIWNYYLYRTRIFSQQDKLVY